MVNMSGASGQQKSKQGRRLADNVIKKLSKKGIMNHSLELTSAYDNKEFITSFMTNFAGIAMLFVCF